MLALHCDIWKQENSNKNTHTIFNPSAMALKTTSINLAYSDLTEPKIRKGKTMTCQPH
jgi:hypothetical protein